MVPSPPARIDTKSFVHFSGGSLSGNLPPGDVVPAHDWYRDGLAFRNSPDFVRYGGPGKVGHPGMGYFGFAAGPGKHIVDPVALSDPLLARLPGRIWWTKWKPGHFRRKLPKGYMPSVETGENRIVDPTLARYYEKIRLITRGPLFDTARLRAIIAINLGAYDDWLNDYVARNPNPRRAGRKSAPPPDDRIPAGHRP